MTTFEIVMRLIGPIHPVGESNEDDERHKNLEDLCDLVINLMNEIKYVRDEKNRHEFSIKRAGERADKFLNYLKSETLI